MKSKKQNCWEYMKCRREPGGEKADKLGECPAAIDSTFDGFNLGHNAGRTCWLVAGTFCNGKVQGSFAKKRVSCRECDFYQKVNYEESITQLSVGSMRVLALTNIGLVRKTNEDRYLIKKLDNDTLLLAIADGLGGEAAGDYAAEILRGRLAGIEHIPRDKEQQEFERLVKDIDMTIYNEAKKKIDLEGMGSTLVGVILRGGFANWVHVGDSRLYIFRDQQLIQITEDQTFARFLLEEGEITAEQVPTHYSRHIMDQCVGCGICEPETGQLEIKGKGLLILTTDGLHKSISNEEMISLLNADTNIETKARSLVQAALDSGGNDNITILIASSNN
jgi:serine/threonine protein phosphatase PrpC